MKIGIIQASSQKSKNCVLEHCLREVITNDDEIFNFGVFEHEEVNLSYIQIAFCVSLLIESRAIDFIITGCSSGQGMMLACNSFYNVTCGYVSNVTDAYLFGRINDGNAISYPLGINWGWTAEINLKETLKALFIEPFGCGYPDKEADRKKQDTKRLKQINAICKKSVIDILPMLDEGFVAGVLNYNIVYDFIMENGINDNLKKKLREYKHDVSK